MKKKTLIELAQEVPVAHRIKIYSEDEIGLAIAWFKGGLRAKQIKKALGLKDNAWASLYCFLSLSIKQAYKDKKISLKQI